MRLKSLKEVAGAVEFGRKVVIRCSSKRSAYEMGREIMDHISRGMESASMETGLIRHRSGGFAHLVVEDREVAGMEYHDSLGMLTEIMATRVRLDDPKNTEVFPHVKTTP